MARLIKFGTEAREQLLEGARILSDVVGSTLGPLAHNVAISRTYGPPMVIHDGVSASREVDLVDPFQAMGANLLKEAASKTNDAAGDGTTTATVLGYAIAQEAHRNIVAGSNAMLIRKGIEIAVEAMDKKLTEMAIPISKDGEILQIATISAQNPEIGEIVAEGIKRMGKDGVLAVEESGNSQTYLEIKEGMEFSKGWVHRYFVTNQELGEAVLDKPYILITDMKITNVTDILDFLKSFAEEPNKENKNILIIAEEISGSALEFLALNKINGVLNICAVKAPGFGEKQKDMLKDIAIVTGGKYFSTDVGEKLTKDNFNLEDLGRASRVTATEKATIIVDGAGDKEDIQLRILELKNTVEKSELEFDREKLQERIARLTTGVGIVYVGASSETEMRERKERFIDAISATKAAMDEGIVPGGETALIRASLAEIPVHEVADIQIGINIIRKASEEPFKKLMANVKFDSGRKLNELEHVLGKNNWGIDATDGRTKDLVKHGIIDPVKVTKSALKNAASCAVMIITTDTLLVDEPEKKQPHYE